MLNIKEVNQLVASDGEVEDYFGCSVALSSDGLVCIVGANSSDTKAHKAGKVYTYSRDTIDDDWKEVNQLVARYGDTEDFFGRSVALSGDGLVAIVGTFGSVANSGIVYTYSRDSIDGDWVEVSMLLASDGKAYNYFGSSVALSSNGLVATVGAFGNNINTGKVYTYSRDTIDDDWKEVNQLVASDDEQYNFFGYSVALSGNGLVAMVGAYYIKAKAHKAGKVYTYSRDTINDNWVEVNQLTGSGGKAYDYFGISVALSSDGLVAIVGAYSSDTKADAAGKVYTYSRATINDDWVEVNQLTASDGKVADIFGRSVALSSNGLVAIVSIEYNNTGTGRVYTYTINTNSN